MKKHTSNVLVRGKAKSFALLCYPLRRMSKRGAESPGDRLRRARVAAGFESAMKAARALRLHYQNLIDHESGRRGISEDMAREYGRKFKQSWVWIMTGHNPDERATIPLMGAIGAGAEVVELGAQEIDRIELPAGAAVGDIAFVIRGASMSPFLEGGIIVARPTDDIGSVLYHLAAVELDDGRRFFKRIMPSTRTGYFTLLSLGDGERPIPDVRIMSAARFRVYVEPD